MLLVIKLLFVALAVAGQSQLFPDREKPLLSELDTLALPHEHPEWALARRAMAANGLCRFPDTATAANEPVSAPVHPVPVRDTAVERMFAEACE